MSAGAGTESVIRSIELRARQVPRGKIWCAALEAWKLKGKSYVRNTRGWTIGCKICFRIKYRHGVMFDHDLCWNRAYHGISEFFRGGT